MKKAFKCSIHRCLSVLLAVAMTLTLAACGAAPAASSEASSVAPATSPATPDASAQPDSSAPAMDAGDITSWIFEPDKNMSGTVRFWMPFKGDAGMNDLIADFNKSYPNIKVELVTYNNNADGNLSVNTSIMAGEVDVLGSFGLNGAYNRWANNLYMDLTDKIAEEGIDLKANWGTDVYKHDNTVYTLPCGGLSNYIAINMTAWEEAGLGALPTEWTWDEYLEASKKMTKTAANGEVTMYGGSDYHSVNYYTFPKYQITGRDQYYNDDGTCALDSDLIVNALAREVKAELVDKIWYPKGSYRADNLQAQMTYTKGQVASIINTNMVRFLRDTANYPVTWITGFAPYPVEQKGQTNYMSGVPAFSHAGIATGCKDPDAAWAFLKWYSTYGSKYLVVAGHQSTWKGTKSEDLVPLIFGSEENAKKLIDIDSFRHVVGVATNPAYVDSCLTAYTEVVGLVNEYGMYALTGEMTAKDAMVEASKLANEAIQAEK